MPMLIRCDGHTASWLPETFEFIADDELVPPKRDVIVSLARLQAEGDALFCEERCVGVRLGPAEAVEDLAYDLACLAVVDLEFAKFRDGRPFSSARILRDRLKYRGQVRASGEVLRDQALQMVRCGFNVFEPADGSTPEEWLASVGRYRSVYQAASDDRAPIHVERYLRESGLGHNRGQRPGWRGHG